MSDDENDPIQGPMPSQEWLRAKRERIAAEEREREERDQRDWLSSLAERATSEAAAWQQLPCGGELQRVGACSDAIAVTCERRDHVMCPRRQLVTLRSEQQEARRALRSTLVGSGVPERVLCAVFDQAPLETEAVRLLREALVRKPAPIFVVLSGGVGCGKSCAAASWLAGTGGGDWVSAADLATLSPYEATGRERLRGARLVLDDLGTEYVDGKGFMAALLDGVVDHRYANLLPTVVTTNLGPGDFRDRYGPRVADRLREAGAFIVVGGKSLRRRGGA